MRRRMSIEDAGSGRVITCNMRWRMLPDGNDGRSGTGSRGQSRSCKTSRKHLLDLDLAPVRGGFDQLVRSLMPEMRCQQTHRCQMEPAFRQRREKGGQTAG